MSFKSMMIKRNFNNMRMVSNGNVKDVHIDTSSTVTALSGSNATL